MYEKYNMSIMYKWIIKCIFLKWNIYVMFNVNWINCISHCFILKYIMYSTNPTNPGEDFV